MLFLITSFKTYLSSAFSCTVNFVEGKCRLFGVFFFRWILFQDLLFIPFENVCLALNWRRFWISLSFRFNLIWTSLRYRRSEWVQLFTITLIECISFNFKFLTLFWCFIYILILCWTRCCVTILWVSWSFMV